MNRQLCDINFFFIFFLLFRSTSSRPHRRSLTAFHHRHHHRHHRPLHSLQLVVKRWAAEVPPSSMGAPPSLTSTPKMVVSLGDQGRPPPPPLFASASTRPFRRWPMRPLSCFGHSTGSMPFFWLTIPSSRISLPGGSSRFAGRREWTATTTTTQVERAAAEKGAVEIGETINTNTEDQDQDQEIFTATRTNFDWTARCTGTASPGATSGGTASRRASTACRRWWRRWTIEEMMELEKALGKECKATALVVKINNGDGRWATMTTSTRTRESRGRPRCWTSGRTSLSFDCRGRSIRRRFVCLQLFKLFVLIFFLRFSPPPVLPSNGGDSDHPPAGGAGAHRLGHQPAGGEDGPRARSLQRGQHLDPPRWRPRGPPPDEHLPVGRLSRGGGRWGGGGGGGGRRRGERRKLRRPGLWWQECRRWLGWWRRWFRRQRRRWWKRWRRRTGETAQRNAGAAEQTPPNLRLQPPRLDCGAGGQGRPEHLPQSAVLRPL